MFTLRTNEDKTTQNPESEFVVLGHRGACAYQTENTMASFKEALERGSKWVEFDVQLTKDGVAVIFHDFDLKRLAKINKNISDVLFSDLPLVKTHLIPDASQVIDFLSKNQMMAHIEIKNPNAVKQVAEILKKEENKNFKYVISSFDHGAIVQAKKLNPQHRTLALFERAPKNAPEKALAVGAEMMGFSFEWWKLTMRKKVPWDLPCYAFTINSSKDLGLALKWGFSGVYSDCPDKMKSLLTQDNRMKDLLICGGLPKFSQNL